MTREQFIERAIRTAERAASLPRGWWGTWRDTTNGMVRVVFSPHGRCWRLLTVQCAIRGTWLLVSKHDSREHALRKAARL